MPPLDLQACEKAEGACFYHRYSQTSPWEPYTVPECYQIYTAMKQSPAGGKMPFTLGGNPFEVRWGYEAKSDKWGSRPPEHGILQVNMSSGNTREVMGQPGDPARQPSYSHQDPRTKEWTPYSTQQKAMIAAAQNENPGGGKLDLPGIPFCVKWGSHAKGTIADTGTTGMCQVNTKTGNMRVVRKEDPEPAAADVSDPAPTSVNVTVQMPGMGGMPGMAPGMMPGMMAPGA